MSRVRSFAIAFLVGSVLLVVPPAAAQQASSSPSASAVRPPDVRPEQWLAFSPTAGIALSAPSAGPNAPLVGTLFILDSGTWRRVYVESPRRAPSAVPASRLRGARGAMSRR